MGALLGIIIFIGICVVIGTLGNTTHDNDIDKLDNI